MRLMRGMIVAMAAAIVFAACPARAGEKVITLGERTTLTLKQAIEMAYTYNLDIKQAETDKLISTSKLKEAKAANGFSLGLSGNYAQTLNSNAVAFPLITYDTMSVSVMDPTNPPAGLLTIATASLTTAPSASTSVLVPYGIPNVNYINMMSKLQKGASFTVTKPIYTFGKIENNIRLNRIGIQTSDLSLRRERLNVVLKVKQAYYQYLLAMEFLNVTKETVLQSQAHLDAAKARFEVGASPRFDVIRSEVDVASAKENLAKAQKSVDLARMALANVIGIDVHTPLTIEKPDSSGIISLSVETSAAVAIKERPELKQLKLGQKQAELGAALSRLTPTLGFQGSYALLNKGSSFGQQDSWQLAVGMDFPLYDSGSARAKSKQAMRTRDKLLQTEEQARQGIILQVNEAYLSMNEANARVETSQKILDTATEAVRMAEAGYKEGVTPGLDVLDAQNGLNSARLNAAQAKFDFEIAKARLLDAMGVEDISDIKE